MPTFGISAFLRIVHLNERPQLTELRRRAGPRSSGGYDFHASTRRLAHRLLVDLEPLEDALEAALEIAQPSERNSAIRALQRLNEWRLAINPGPVLEFGASTYRSESEAYRVTFTPNFGVRIGSQAIAVHVWNTVTPKLEPRIVRSILSLFSESYRHLSSVPDDIAVLCLRTMRLIRLGDATDVRQLGQLLARNIDGIFQDIADQADDHPERPEDRPPALPPGR